MDSVSMWNEDFNLSYDENDAIQVEEDSWVSDVLGTEDAVIQDLVYGK